MKKDSWIPSAVMITIIIGVLVGGVLLYKTLAPNSRFVSRWTGKTLELTLPSDLHLPSKEDRPHNLVVSVTMGNNGGKFLTYYNAEGALRVKEYTDYGVLASDMEFVQKKKKK